MCGCTEMLLYCGSLWTTVHNKKDKKELLLKIITVIIRYSRARYIATDLRYTRVHVFQNFEYCMVHIYLYVKLHVAVRKKWLMWIWWDGKLVDNIQTWTAIHSSYIDIIKRLNYIINNINLKLKLIITWMHSWHFGC